MHSATGHEVRDRLCRDHLRLEGFLAAVQAAFDSEDPVAIACAWTPFEKELLAHLEVEETFLIPVLFRTNRREGRALLEEHRHIRARLAELSPGVTHANAQARTARAFIEELRAHARHEDNVLYSWADDNVGEPERQSLLEFLGETSAATPAAG
jgi:hemerythrin-like domain-containing protein